MKDQDLKIYKKLKNYYKMPFLLRDFLNVVTLNFYKSTIKNFEKKYSFKKNLEKDLK